MSRSTQSVFLSGTAGKIECALDLPDTDPIGIALVAHPHPLYGGTMDNKVVQILARTFASLGYATMRINFRGVGQTAGEHDQGRGETDDMALALDYMKKNYPSLPVALGGFSFGTYVQANLCQRLVSRGEPPLLLLLVGAMAGQVDMPPVPNSTLLIHGEKDELIPLTDVLDWARPQDIPVIVIPGADHLFNGKLHHLRKIMLNTVPR